MYHFIYFLILREELELTLLTINCYPFLKFQKSVFDMIITQTSHFFSAWQKMKICLFHTRSDDHRKKNTYVYFFGIGNLSFLWRFLLRIFGMEICHFYDDFLLRLKVFILWFHVSIFHSYWKSDCICLWKVFRYLFSGIVQSFIWRIHTSRTACLPKWKTLL